MNIFATDPCPIKSAQFLDDKRVIKMILESAQMLCTALHQLGYDKEIPYKQTLGLMALSSFLTAVAVMLFA